MTEENRVLDFVDPPNQSLVIWRARFKKFVAYMRLWKKVSSQSQSITCIHSMHAFSRFLAELNLKRLAH